MCAAAFRRSALGSVDEWIVGGQPMNGGFGATPAGAAASDVWSL
jgi:hypothetical protein